MMEYWLSIPFQELPSALGNGINPFDFPEEEFELYSVPAHETGKPEIVTGKTIGSNKQIVSDGMVLLCKINPKINRTWIVKSGSGRRQIASTEWIAFGHSSVLVPKYLMYFMQQSDFHDFLATNASGVGGSLMRIKPVTFAPYRFRMPGPRCQQAIVEKLEELFSDLDAGVAELKVAQKKLGQYRQSLLKAAVEGGLTAAWRAEQAKRGEALETGAQLLERILTERRKRWEEKQLTKFKEQGKTPPRDWQDKYPEPVKPDIANLPKLPEGWVWASVDQLSVLITSGSRGWAEYYSQSGAVFIRSQDINTDTLVLDSVARVDPPATSEGTRTKVEKYDLLLTITGANVAKCAAVTLKIDKAFVSQHVALIRPVFKQLCGYLHLFLSSRASGRKQLLDFAYGAGKPGLNLQQVASVVVPLAPENEIDQIVDVVTAAFNELVATQETITISLKQSAAQRKNILKSAFSDQLVPQDPNDEPASVLLERIRAERESRAIKGKVRTRKKKEVVHG